MRGEYAAQRRRRCSNGGSSPHAWRIFPENFFLQVLCRFIPTCVENMLPGWTSFSSPSGSSPHAWRISLRGRGNTASSRFIPTCVENMQVKIASLKPYSVHPHMRGEYPIAPAYIGMFLGSSPHAWRISAPSRQSRRGRRFIPTCVENIPATTGRRSRGPVHPHMRGEYASAYKGIGFSAVHPHMRGEYFSRSWQQAL